MEDRIYDLKERAHNKAFSKISALDNDIRKLYRDLEQGKTGSLEIEQFEGLIVWKERERDTWRFILNKINDE